MNCEQVELLLPAYALGALEPAEREAVEDHLDGCPYCTPLAREALEVAAALATASPAATPPPGLRARIIEAASVQARSAEPPPVAAQRPAQAAWQSRPSWTAPAFALAASLVLALVGVLLAFVLSLQGQVRDLREDNRLMASTVIQQNERLVAMIKEQRTLAYGIATPGTQTLFLRNTEQAPQARGMLMVSRDHNWAILVSEGLAPSQQEMGYQVWLIKDGLRTSGGVFTVDETGYGQLFIRPPASLDEFGGIGVTVEPRAGSPGPTGNKVLDAQLR